MAMTKNTTDIGRKNNSPTRKALLLGTSLCLTVFINGCNGRELTHVNEAYRKPWEEVSKEKMGNETSHMQAAAENDISIEKEGMENAIAVPAAEVDSTPLLMSPPIEMAEEKRIIPVPKAPKPSNFNPKNIFGKSLRSDSDRLDRLERATQDMRNDFNAVQPSIRRLMAIEGDIQNLIAELEKLNADPSLATGSMTSKRAAKATRTTRPQVTKNTKSNRKQILTPSRATSSTNFVKKSPPSVDGAPNVYDVRIGEHPGKTRIVMDINSKVGFNIDIDNNEHIMIVELPNASWSAAMSKSFAKSPYITSYNAEASGSGYIAIFQLKRDARIGYKADLDGFTGSSRRIVIDVTS
jgi:hypothetical protein